MRFRTKLLVATVGLALASNLIVLLVAHRNARAAVLAGERSKVLSIAATAAALLDGAGHEELVASGSTTGGTYRRIERALRAVRDANRREDVQVRFVYTLARLPGQEQVVVFGVDAEENPAEKSRPGEVYRPYTDKPSAYHDQAPYASEGFEQDQWGVWLTADAPVRDASGAVIATVGVDINAADALAKVEHLFWSGVVALALATAAAAAIGFLLSRAVTRPLESIRSATQAIAIGDWSAQAVVHSQDEFAGVASAVNDLARSLRERDNLKNVLVRYVSRQVAERILASGEMPNIQGERRRITVLFADVRNFSSLAESLGPEEVVARLNTYFEAMIEVVFRHNGTLNKFMGDGLMAMFGAPADEDYQERRALLCALEMRREVERLRQRWQIRDPVDFGIGIGVNTGVAIVGNIGSHQRMEYTAIGETVNVASRIEQATRDLGAEVLVSEYTYVAVKSEFQFRARGLLEARGVRDGVRVFELLGADAAAAEPEPRPGG